MNSRMTFRGGFPISQEGENQIAGSWIPLTPDKPIPARSHPIPVDRFGNQLQRANWQEIGGFSNGYLEETLNHNRPVQNFNSIGGQLSGNGEFYGCEVELAERNNMINQIAGSYGHAINNNRAGWNNNNLLANLLAMKNASSLAAANGELRSPPPNMHSQIDGAWMVSGSRSSLLPNQSHYLGSNLPSIGDSFPNLPNQSPYSSSNLQSIGDSLLRIPPLTGFPIPYQPNFNLNSPPRAEADSISRVTNSFQLAPVTPNQTKKLENNQLSAILRLSADSRHQEKEKQENLVTSIGNEANQYHCDELLQNIVDSTSAAISTPVSGKKDSDGGDEGIDLNKTPQQKPPKRRKHRPKVIVEGKPKRAPKPATNRSTDSKENPTGKRKYVRRKGLDESANQLEDVLRKTSNPNAEMSAKSSERVLNFNLETIEDKTQHKENLLGKRKYVRMKGLNESASQPGDENQGKENQSGKRKYVRRKGLNESSNQLADVMSETTNPNAEMSEKSCKRALKFDLETSRDESQGKKHYQQEIQQRIKRPFNLNLDYHATESCTGTNSVQGRTSAMQVGLQNGLRFENKKTGTTNNLTHSTNQMLTKYIRLLENQVAAAPVATMKDLQMKNLNVIARNIDAGNFEANQNGSKNGYTPIQQHNHGEGIGQLVFQAKTSHENLERSRQLMSQCTPKSVPEILPNSNEARASKRGYCYTTEQMHPCTVNPVSSSLLCQEILLGDECHRNGSSLGSGFSENHKKERIHDGLYKNTYSSPCVKEVEDDSIHGKRKGSVDVNANGCTSEMNHEILNRYFESSKTPKRQNNGVSKFTGDWYIHSMAAAHNFPNRYVSAEPHSCSERMGETGRLTQVHNFVSQTAVENCVMLPPSPPKNAPAPGKHKVLKSCHINVATTKQTVGPTPSKSISTGTDKVLQEQDTLFDYQLSAGKTRGPPGTHKYPIPLDEIISRIKALNINERSTNIEDQEQKALVPYKENGAVVPFHGFIKKRKPRPKVDLDPETDRIWKLLMGKELSESDEVTHKEKENWWEEERRVFQGRAESFIARMHLVQGDRRFSQWKGSVVDSVIGVFLTQNVSDHLSSSAFMSLAAKFPIGSKVNNKTCDKDRTTILVEEPEVCILNPDEAIKWHEEVSGRPAYNQQSTSPLASREHQRDSGTPETERTSLGEANSQNMEEEVISSQDSYDPSVEQGDGGIRSYTGSNSEAEEPTPWCQTNKIHGSTSTNFLQMERTNMFQEFYSLLNGSSLFDEGCNLGHKQLEEREHGHLEPTLDGTDNLKGSSTFTCPINSNNLQMRVPFPSRYYQLQKTQASGILEVGDYEVFDEENISSWPSTASGITMVKDINCMSRRFGQIEESVGKNAAQQNGVPRVEVCTLLSKHTLHKESISEPEHHAECNQPSCGNHQLERNKTFPMESISVTEPVKYAEAPAERQNSTLQHIPNAHMFTEKAFDVEERISAANKLIKPNSKVQVDFSGKEYDKKTNVSKAKRGNADGEKKNPVDWDSLRKQVQANGGKKERSKETMDSMDYEAMRCADVDEISKAIKERGMNNMLAERIKEFLNRLVREHGSIDLEWLRDVPPEKTKDYLLSVRGLGLKSVECVRLLTLHHLAFPVDTNVGRIAVRLGWVPLQPLPESLQLHLLELYPMLESIQKYLWPRLCKLDQRTLYELHYQMITFGKVFCTKSRPNCNACPMRGECRHFASAFASARLALPGPEEKSVVSSTIPVSAKRNSAEVINPAQLPLLANRSIKEVGPIIGNYEPIIEEPTTPEQESVEITESDIEDAFYEDPDEIPTIKLNVEEFTVNLQSYMQENMELQEGDMSKALVALSQEAASIPTPKLKNVSRLRTEHQVYELPDTHPLLKGMDRREPDDPSPYLLAIWTPGETANSIQLPERRCESQKADELCNEKTCFSCNSIREANSETVRGTLLIPCRTAMRGSFPLNGTYFQVNEVFADHDSSLNPIDVPRAWIWNLPRRTVYFGTSVSTIFKGLSTEGIQYCFWRGFVCVRGFDQTLRAPRPLMARLHFPASRLAKTKKENK